MKRLTISEAILHLRTLHPGPARVFVAGCGGEPAGLVRVIGNAPDLARDITFVGVWIPGVNRTDWASLDQSARAETSFMSPDWRAGFEAGRLNFLPKDYVQSFEWLSRTRVDFGFVIVSPPDPQGHVSLGVSPDFAPAILDRPDIPLCAIINPSMPEPKDGPKYSLSRFACIAEDSTPLPELPRKALPPAFAKIGEIIADLIGPEPACLQFGLGNVQQAVLEALAGRKREGNLRIHSGMVSDPVLDLIAAGHIPDLPGQIVTGVALGSPALYELARTDRRFAFRPVSHTHDARILSSIDRFVAINSAIEVDLLGQANAEFLSGQQISATGGLLNFLRGADASAGGLPILALSSTASAGRVSRIVPKLAGPVVSIGRTDTRFVVTEHGMADLTDLDLDGRADVLISIADPAHRSGLEEAWKAIRRGL